MGFDSAIWLLSDGRSGSTWLAQLLDFEGRLHTEHEPIHRSFTAALAHEPLLPMPGGRAVAATYAPLFEAIRAGSFRGGRFGPPRPGARGLLIRDIHGLLIAPDMLRACPWLRPLVIVRHPADVAMSKLALAHWEWFDDLRLMLRQPELADELGPLCRHLETADDPFERYVLVWAVSHRWFFSRVPAPSLPVIRYPSTRAELGATAQALLGPLTSAEAVASASFYRAWAQRSLTDRPQLGGNPFRRLLSTPRLSRARRLYAERVVDAFDLRWLIADEASAVAAE